ncbi:MAG: NAD+ synthase, partial [Gammaproteobacteria bacterium]|nr:NAD+ synthase [Gammaproteobacteria bacterium]
MSGALKIVMAQLNLLVGDIDGNTDKVIDSCHKAIEQHQADVIAFPELTLTSYPPEDLLLRPSIQLRISKALDRIINADLDIYCVIGYPANEDDRLYNALAVIYRGEVLGTYYKQYLPNYQVFDERRYFTPGKDPCLIKIRGKKVAFTICEDLWESGPVAQASKAGARLLVNINASPFHIGKQQERKTLLLRRSEEGNFPIVYVNLVGGQDELVFDGGSMAIDAGSGSSVETPLFSEGLFSLELNYTNKFHIAQEIAPDPMLIEAQIYQALVLGVRDYVNKNHFKGVVVGLSGGIDSALTLAVAVDALSNGRVQAVMLPFEYTSQLSPD